MYVKRHPVSFDTVSISDLTIQEGDDQMVEPDGVYNTVLSLKFQSANLNL